VKIRKPVQHKNIPKHASCLQEGSYVKLQIIWQKIYTLCPEYKALCLGKIQHNTSLSTTLHIFKDGGGFVMLWVCLSSARTKEFFRMRRN
jgi:hypothetical protein